MKASSRRSRSALRVAIIAAASSDDFTNMAPPPNESLPVAVANICDYTFMCDPAPVGPDIHANDAGYALIAETIAATLP